MLREFGTQQPAKSIAVQRENALDLFISNNLNPVQKAEYEKLMAERLEKEAAERAQKQARLTRIARFAGAGTAIAVVSAGATLFAANLLDKGEKETTYVRHNEMVSHVAERLLERCDIEKPNNAQLRDGVEALKDENETLLYHSGATVAEEGTELSLHCDNLEP